MRPNTSRVLAPPIVAPPVVRVDQDPAHELAEESGSYREPSMTGLSSLIASPWLYVTATGLLITGISLSSLLHQASDGLPAYAASSPSQTNLPEPPERMTDQQATTTELAVSPAPLNPQPIDPMIPSQEEDPVHQQESVLVASDAGRTSLASRQVSEPTVIPAVATPSVPIDAWQKTESGDVASSGVQEPLTNSIASIAGDSDKNDDAIDVTLTHPPAQFHLTSLDPGMSQWQWGAQRVGLESVEPTASLPPTAPSCIDGQCPTSLPTYGTTIHWVASPADAYQQAKDENKLVFMMHVSGNFKIPGFT